MKPISRRTMLRGAGRVCIALPLLEAMLPRRATAGGATVPKRIVVFFTPNGTPDQTPNIWEGFAKGVPAGPLANATLPEEAAALEVLKHKLLLISGVHADTSNAPHLTDSGQGDLHSIGMSEILTGVKSQFVGGATFPDALGPMIGQGISVDQYIADQIGGATYRPSLQYGVQSETTSVGTLDGFCRMVYSGPGQPVPAVTDPAEMFMRMFGDGPDTEDTVDMLRAQRRSVLDLVMEDFETLQGRLGARDRQTLDEHLSAIRDLENTLSMSAPQACGAPDSWQNEGGPEDPLNFAVVGRQQTDLLKLALQCDVTRVASLQWSFARSHVVHHWVTDENGVPLSSVDHHQLTHDYNFPEPALTKINAWYAEQLAYLGTQLDAVTEADGSTLLDNTVIWWCTDVSWANQHSYYNIRAFLLGGAGGALKQGEHVVLSPGHPHQKLLVTLMQAMGLPDDRFGDDAYEPMSGGALVPIEPGPLPGVLVNGP